MRILPFVLPLSLALLTLSLGHAKSSEESNVLATLEKMHQAGLRRDIAAMQALYSPEYFHTNADGSIMTLAQVYDSYRAPTQYTFDSTNADEQHVIVHGNLAIVNERVSLH